MMVVDHTCLCVRGALEIRHLTTVEFHVGVNAHGWAVVEGEADKDAFEKIHGAVADQQMEIIALEESGAERSLFAGVIQEAELVYVGEYWRLHVRLQSGTILLDREKRSRSFQEVEQTFSQVAERVVSTYQGGAVITSVGETTALKRPVIQYRETDWEFLMRMASWCGGVVVPETKRGLPRLWFGFPPRSYECSFPEDTYTSGISEQYYALGGASKGFNRADFLYYDVNSREICDLGWYTRFKEQSFFICEKSAKLEHGELIFTYRLGRIGLGWGEKYNVKISGMTLLGEVISTARETIKLKLDIDTGWNAGGPYAYTWRPETGNMMYCMPQPGTRVSLYFPSYDEQKAMAVNCVRTNGASCSRMADPSKRAFVTEHGKEMNLNPNEMSLMGGAEGKIVLSDNTGMIISTQKPLSMKGKRISFEAPSVDIFAVGNELILAKAKVDGGGAKTCVSMMHQFDLFSMQHTHLEGWKCQSFDACKDTIEVVEFDANEVIGNVFAGLAIVAAVVAVVGVVVASGGLAAVGIVASAAGSVAMSAAAVGATAVIGKGISDYQSKEVSSTESYMLTGLLGATAGAVSGGVGVLIEGATPTGLALGAKMGIVGTGGVVETFIENTIMGRQTTLFDAGFSFVLSAGLFGIGDNIGRALKRWRSGAKQADDAIGEVVDQVNNILSDISDDVSVSIRKRSDTGDPENLFSHMSEEDQRRYIAWEQAHVNGIIPDNPDAYVRFGYLLDRGVDYDNAYFLATLDRNIYEAFDEGEIVQLITNVEDYASTLSKRRRNPAVAGVYNKHTGEFYYGTNLKSSNIPILAPQLKEYFENIPRDVLQSYADMTVGAGTHAEILALNDALWADPSASIDDFLLYVMHGNNLDYGMPFLRCPHCQWITQQFYSVYK